MVTEIKKIDREVSKEISDIETKKFIKELEKDIGPFAWEQLFLNYTVDREGYSRECPFCITPGFTMRYDPIKRKFSCPVCEVKGSLVRYLMIYRRITLKEAIKCITDYVIVNVPIPSHLLK